MRTAEDADPQDLSDAAGGVQIDTATLGNSLAESYRAEYSAGPLLGVYARETHVCTAGDTTGMLVAILPTTAQTRKLPECSTASE